MKIANAMISIAALAATCVAQPFTLEGIVTDKGTGSPLKGVAVKLLKGGISSATDDAGKFQLVVASTAAQNRESFGSGPSLLSNGDIGVSLLDEETVSIETFSMEGRLPASSQRRMGAGSYRMSAPIGTPGTYFHRVWIGDRQTIIRSSWYGGKPSGNAVSQGGGFGAARAMASDFKDTIEASLSGYGTSRLEVTGAVTTNLSMLLARSGPTGTVKKARVIHTTDLQADPDDEQSLVHMFVNSNDVDLEGLIVSTSCWRKTQSSTSYIDKFVNAYEKAYPNLKVHADGFPTPAYVKSIVALGQKSYSMGDVGSGKDSPGSNLIIAAVDKNDPRPVWVNLWGGGNTLAQAIYKVKSSRSQAELDKFIAKLRVYDILGQDETGAWMTKTYPNLFYIRATGVYGWTYSDSWLTSNVQNKGELGKAYPNTKYSTEGDSPAFLHELANGLNDPEIVDQGGWGGRFDNTKKKNIASMSAVTGEGTYNDYTMYGNTSEGSNAITKWKDGYTNNFAARMIWSTTSNYSSANHHPIAIVNNDKSRDVLYIIAKAGSDVVLDGAGSSDPDKNSLTWSWTQYSEPSTGGTASIAGGNTSKATVKAPAAGKNFHIILILKDNGSPALTVYRRVVIKGS